MQNEYMSQAKMFSGIVLALILLALGGYSQDKDSERNYQMGIPYAISDIESINTTNGNLIFNFDFGNARGRGTALNGIALKYNSKLYESHVMETLDSSGQMASQLFLRDSEEGGWQFDEPYRIRVISRQDGLDPPIQYADDCGKPNYKAVYVWKLMMYFPDGSQHEFRPTGYSDKHTSFYGQLQTGDGYFNVATNGQVTDLNYSCTGGLSCPTICSTQVVTYQDQNPKMTYYSADETHLRLEIPNGQNNRYPNKWTLFMPDGSKVVSDADAQNNPLPQKIYDRNGNYVQQGVVTLPDGTQAGGWVDQVGRYVARKSNLAALEDYIYKQGYNGEILKWTVKWKDISVIRPYTTSGATDGRIRGGSSEQLFCALLRVVDKIYLPEQLGGLQYSFNYNAHSPAVECNVNNPNYSSGWGELMSVTLPSGARAEYDYAALIASGTETLLPLLGKVREKRLIYDTVYDGSASPITEKWTYSISQSGITTITAPDGGVTTQYYYTVAYDNEFSGRVYNEVRPDGTIVERIWQNNQPNGFLFGSMRRLNTYVKTEFTTIADAAGNPTLTAIKDFNYDKNGNVTKIVEYDWVSYSTIQHASSGPPVVTGIPIGITPVRITENAYYNQTEDATNTTTNNPNSYWNTTAPLIRNALASTKVTKANGEVVAYSEFGYDNPATTGNLTESKSWDSSKGSLSYPLTLSNAVITTAQYDQYGNPTLQTDAKGNQTQITYGAVGGFTGLYPTQTVSAYNTAIQQTVQSEYDFYTGLAKKVTALGNNANENIVTETEYDALGRPRKVKAAVGTPQEVWTQTEYSDQLRRIITRADLFGLGDGRKVTIQHFDQLGRIRLARELEDSTTQDATNETHGVKIQTRYAFDNPSNPSQSNGEYTLTSNPFRAAYSYQAANEPTMGWQVEYEDKSGNLSTTKTFSGTTLPAPWGTNANLTGLSQAEEDTNATILTDEAGKKRRTVKDGLGQLIRVDEPDGNNNLGSINSPIQPTNYSYDARGNLTQILQGGQTRSFVYDSLNRLKQATNPESGTFQYAYDANGNLLTKTDARNISTTYTYDALNRVTFRNYSDATPDISYFYDDTQVPFSRGKLTKVSSSISETRYTAFDAEDRLLGSQQITDGQTYSFGYTYNLNGDLLTQTYPSNKVVKYDYSNDGDLAQVSNNQTQKVYANSFTYTAHGQVEKLRLGNGKWETTAFNSRLQATQIGLGHSATDTGLWKTNYEYGEWESGTLNQQKNNGSLARQTFIVPTIGAATGFTAVQTYNYDSLDRLKSAAETISGNQSWKQTFLYDRFGNKNFDTANTTTLGSCASAVCNPTANQADNRLNGYGYDNAGNITANGEGRTFTYDGENRQLTAVGSSLSMSYAYDGNGERVKSFNAVTNQTTIFVYDADGDLAAEYTINVPAPQNPTISYLTEDALGSVRVTTNSFGEVKARRDFFPFGEEIYAGIGNRTTNQKYSSNADDTRKKFATYQRDVETGLDFAQSRYYSPMQGRFTSPDEFKGGPDELFDFEEDASTNPTFYADLENPQSLNKYQYTYNNPYKYTDPNGHCPFCLPIVAGAIAFILSNPTPTGKREKQTTAEAIGDIAGILPIPGSKFIGGAIARAVIRGTTKTAVKQTTKQVVKQTVKQTTKQSVKQTTKQTTKKTASSKVKNSTTQKTKLKKERSAQGAQNQRESIQKSQEFLRKRGQGEKIRSIEKSKQNEKTELKNIKNLKDAEEKFKP